MISAVLINVISINNRAFIGLDIASPSNPTDLSILISLFHLKNFKIAINNIKINYNMFFLATIEKVVRVEPYELGKNIVFKIR